MKVLVACEYSGIVRDAFTAAGHDATSCDLLDTEAKGKHYKGNVFDIINDGWDLMIAHPPCTFLSSAGLHFCRINIHGQKAIDRIKKRNQAVEFFLDLLSTPVNHICIENPLGYISSAIIEPTQIIHPYYFGEAEMKRTALWLKNLPPLQYKIQPDLFGERTASDYPQPYNVQVQKKTGRVKNRYFTDGWKPNGKLKTGKEKSKSFQSIAKAMAEQWGSIT